MPIASEIIQLERQLRHRSAGSDSYLVKGEQEGDKTSREYCDAKLRALGYEESTDKGASEYREEQKRRYDICLQARSAEATEDAAIYARKQYIVAGVSLGFVFLATAVAGSAAWFTYLAADAAAKQAKAAAQSAFDSDVFMPFEVSEDGTVIADEDTRVRLNTITLSGPLS